MIGELRALRTLCLLGALGLTGCASWFSDESVDPTVHLVKVEVVKACWNNASPCTCGWITPTTTT